MTHFSIGWWYQRVIHLHMLQQMETAASSVRPCFAWLIAWKVMIWAIRASWRVLCGGLAFWGNWLIRSRLTAFSLSLRLWEHRWEGPSGLRWRVGSWVKLGGGPVDA